MPRSIDEPDVYNYLDMWSGHLPEEDIEALTNDAVRTRGQHADLIVLIVFKYDAGWFVITPHEDIFDDTACDEAAKVYSPTMITILKSAQEHDCCFVRFDADGLKYDDLEDHSQ